MSHYFPLLCAVARRTQPGWMKAIGWSQDETELLPPRRLPASSVPNHTPVFANASGWPFFSGNTPFSRWHTFSYPPKPLIAFVCTTPRCAAAVCRTICCIGWVLASVASKRCTDITISKNTVSRCRARPSSRHIWQWIGFVAHGLSRD